jgi:hypothetical protein
MRDRVATGKRLWRTCESQVEGLTPDGTIAVGGPAYGDGYSPLEVSALDAKNRLVRQWTGALFLETVVEDDQHFLVIADNGAPRPAASSAAPSPPGTCEIAVPLSGRPGQAGRLSQPP